MSTEVLTAKVQMHLFVEAGMCCKKHCCHVSDLSGIQ